MPEKISEVLKAPRELLRKFLMAAIALRLTYGPIANAESPTQDPNSPLPAGTPANIIPDDREVENQADPSRGERFLNDALFYANPRGVPEITSGEILNEFRPRNVGAITIDHEEGRYTCNGTSYETQQAAYEAMRNRIGLTLQDLPDDTREREVDSMSKLMIRLAEEHETVYYISWGSGNSSIFNYPTNVTGFEPGTKVTINGEELNLDWQIETVRGNPSTVFLDKHGKVLAIRFYPGEEDPDKNPEFTYNEIKIKPVNISGSPSTKIEAIEQSDGSTTYRITEGAIAISTADDQAVILNANGDRTTFTINWETGEIVPQTTNQSDARTINLSDAKAQFGQPAYEKGPRSPKSRINRRPMKSLTPKNKQ